MIIECKKAVSNPYKDEVVATIDLNLDGRTIHGLRNNPIVRESLAEAILKEIEFKLKQQDEHKNHQSVEKQTGKILRKLPTKKPIKVIDEVQIESVSLNKDKTGFEVKGKIIKSHYESEKKD